jgi:hypothetical protein
MSYFKGVDLQEGLLAKNCTVQLFGSRFENTALRRPVVTADKLADYQSLIKDCLLIMSFFANEINRVLI